MLDASVLIAHLNLEHKSRTSAVAGFHGRRQSFDGLFERAPSERVTVALTTMAAESESRQFQFDYMLKVDTGPSTANDTTERSRTTTESIKITP